MIYCHTTHERFSADHFRCVPVWGAAVPAMAQAAKPEVANTTFGAPVYRGDGLRLYGLDAELELKAQEKRDPELESSLEKWIEEVIGETLEPKNNLQKSLKSGVVLCKMMNKLYPGSIKTINMKPIGMMEMENIGVSSLRDSRCTRCLPSSRLLP